MSVIGEAFVAVRPNTKGFEKEAEKDVLGSITSIAKKGAALIGGAFAVKGAVNFLRSATEEARESNKVAAQTNAVLASTAGIAKVTADEVGNLASAISAKTGIDDEAIQSGENLLLTFTNIRNEVGKGNDVFDQATRIMVDMGAALGTDASGSAIQLGKALNDPIAGITALTRVGVSFTEQQKAQIEQLQKSGDILGAQKIILGELSREFEGSAEAQATGWGKLQILWGNAKETLGNVLVPIIDRVANILSEVLPRALDVAGNAFGRVAAFVKPFVDGLVAGWRALTDGIRGIDPGARLASDIAAAREKVTRATEDGARREAQAQRQVAAFEESLTLVRKEQASEVAKIRADSAKQAEDNAKKVTEAEAHLAEVVADQAEAVKRAKAEQVESEQEWAEKVAAAEAAAAEAVAVAQRAVDDAKADWRSTVEDSNDSIAEAEANLVSVAQTTAESVAKAKAEQAAAVEEATQRIVEAEESAARAQEDAEDRLKHARASANDKRQDAARKVTRAEQDLAIAQASGDPAKIIKAQRDLQDARTEQARTARDTSEQVRDAERDVERAAEDGAKNIAKAKADAAAATARANANVVASERAQVEAVAKATAAVADAKKAGAEAVAAAAKKVADSEAAQVKAVKAASAAVARSREEAAKAAESTATRVADAEKAQSRAVDDATKSLRVARDKQAADAKEVAEKIAKVNTEYAAKVAEAEKAVADARRSQVAVHQEVATAIAKANTDSLANIESAQKRYEASLTGWQARLRTIGGGIADTFRGLFDPESINADGIITKGEEIGRTLRTAFDTAVEFWRGSVVPVLDTVRDMLTKVAKVVTENFVPALQTLYQWSKNVFKFFKENGVPTLAALAAILTLVVIPAIAAYTATAISAGVATGILVSPITLVAVAVGALAFGIVYAYQHVDAFRNIVDTVARVLRVVVVGAINLAREAWDRFGGSIMRIVDGALTIVRTQIQAVIDVLRGVITFISGVFSGDWGKAWDGIKQVFSGIIDGILGTLRGLGKMLLGAVSLGWDVFKVGIGVLWAGIKAGPKKVVDEIVDFFVKLPGRLLGLVAAVGRAAGRIGGALVDGVLDLLKSAPADLAKAAGNIGKEVLNGLAGVIEAVLNTVTGAINGMIRVINNFDFTVPKVTVSVFGKKFTAGGWTIGLPDIPQINGGKPFKLPRLAEGGIIPAVPGGMAALLGEGGRREAVLPLPPGLLEGLMELVRNGGSNRPTGPLVNTLNVYEARDPFATGIEVVRQMRAEQYRKLGV